MSEHNEPGDSEAGGSGPDLVDVEAAYEEYEDAERRARHEAVYNRSLFRGLQIETDVDFYPEAAGRRPGETNIVARCFDLHPQVTFWSSGLLIAFIAFTLIFSDVAEDGFDAVLSGINTNFRATTTR